MWSWAAAALAAALAVAVVAVWIAPAVRERTSGPAVASMFAASPTALPPPGTRVFTPTELAQCNGQDATLPLYLAVKGVVYDVSDKRAMYGPGQGYNVFTGRDASRALGMSSLNLADCVADYSTLNEKQRKTLDDWEAFYRRRYPIVGTVQQ